MNSEMDFHIHSLYSDDGEFSPTELVRMCSSKGIEVMSIADHNCAKANEEAKKAAETAGIIYIPGIEIDCVFQQINLHLLGYGIDYKSRDFQDIEDAVARQGEAASGQMLEATQNLGFRISRREMEEVSKGSYWANSWNGEMFAEVLLHKEEYREHPLLKPYRTGGERNDNPYVNFYWDFYSQGKPCYVKVEYPSMDTIIEVIHNNGGKAVIAHPGVNLKGREEVLKFIVKMGIDGVEAYSSYHSSKQAEYFHHEAAENKLFVTCGSDFHGKTKPKVELGRHGGEKLEWEKISGEFR